MFPQASLHTLSNGMRVVLVPDDHVESAAFALFVASGSRHEPARLAGISHFIEHMLFKGTSSRTARDINRAVEGRGGSFNAYTTEEHTCFYAHMPAEFAAVAIDVISDMYLDASIAGEEFAREREVIIQEIGMYRDEPDSVASENLSLALFPGNPVGTPIAGSPEALRAMSPADLRAYMRAHYVPSATVAVVAGRFDSGEVLADVERRFGSLARGRMPSFRRFDARRRVVPEVEVGREVNQTQLAFGWRTPFGRRDSRRHALSVLDCIMGRTMSSRLFESIREKRALSYDIRSNAQLFDETGAFTVAAGVDPGRAGRAYRAILSEIDRIRTHRPSAEETRRAKEYLTGHFRMAFERTVSRIFYYGPSVLAFGRAIPPDELVAKISAVTPDDVFKVAKDVFDDSLRSVSRVVPKTAPAEEGEAL